MRVISQDGMIDIPYDMSVVNVDYRNNKNIVATIAGCGEIENLCQMAKYLTEAKAIKAMEMLREAHLSRMELDGGYDAVSGCYVQPNYWVLPKVFQFPKDEEIEVEDEYRINTKNRTALWL